MFVILFLSLDSGNVHPFAFYPLIRKVIHILLLITMVNNEPFLSFHLSIYSGHLSFALFYLATGYPYTFALVVTKKTNYIHFFIYFPIFSFYLSLHMYSGHVQPLVLFLHLAEGKYILVPTKTKPISISFLLLSIFIPSFFKHVFRARSTFRSLSPSRQEEFRTLSHRL